MPFAKRKLPKVNRWKVYNTKTKRVYAKRTTLKNAKAQLRVLWALQKK